MQSPFLLAAVLIKSARPTLALLLLFGSSLQLIGGINPFYLPLVLIPVGLVTLWRSWSIIPRLFPSVAVALMIVNIAPSFFGRKAPQAHQDFAFPYRIDVPQMETGAITGTTYSSIDDHGDLPNSEIVVLEHDPPHDLAKFNWTQQRLWIENQYYGAVLFRIATGLDGFLYSNLGSKVNKSGLRLLGEAHRKEYNDFISMSSGTLFYSDSDFLNNGAIGYQRHLIDASFRKISFAHSVLFGTALGFLLSLWGRTRSAAIILLAVTSIIYWVAMHYLEIDIRLVDDHAPWPHSQGVGGVASQTTPETGILTVGRTGRAQILCVARDCSATHMGEKIIVMEGGSTVKIGSVTFEAQDYPLGTKDGIDDAIPIRRIGSRELGSCNLKVGNIILIGTNSARRNWHTIHDAAQ